MNNTNNTFVDISLLTDYLLYLDTLTKDQQRSEKDGAFLSVENIQIILYYAQLCSMYIYKKPMFGGDIIVNRGIEIPSVGTRFNFFLNEDGRPTKPNTDVLVFAVPKRFPNIKEYFNERILQSRHVLSVENKQILEILYYYFYKKNFSNVKPRDILEKDRLLKYFQAATSEQEANGRIIAAVCTTVPNTILESYAERLFFGTDIKEQCGE